MLKTSLKFFKSQKQFQNLTIYGFGQVFNLITPFLVMPYIISICGESGYGKIGIGMAWAFFIMVFVDYGSEITGVKEVAVNRENTKKLEAIFITTYATKLLLLITIIAILSIVFFTIPYFSTDKSLFFFSLAMVVGQFINPTWFLQGVENFKWITILNILSKIIYLAGVFIFIHEPEDYVLSNLIWGLGMILANTIAFLYVVFDYSFSFSNTKKSEVKKLLKQNFSLFSSQIFVSLQMYAPIVFIGIFGGNTMAGQFKIVDQIIVIFKTYLLLFFNFVYPRICYLLDKSRQEAMRFWITYNGLNLIFITICMTVVFIFSTEVVLFFNPTQVQLISDLLKIAVFIPVIQAISIPLKQLVLAENKQKQYVRITMIMTVLSLLLIVIITPLYQVLGVVLSLIIAEILISFIFYWTIKKQVFVR